MSDSRPNNVVQGVTQVATGVVSSMQSQPLAIALLVINILFVGMLVFVMTQLGSMRALERAQNQAILDELRKQCGECRYNKMDLEIKQ